MKPVRLILMCAAFVIMVAATFNYYMIVYNEDGKLGVYLELAAIGLIAIAVSILGYKEKRKQ